MKLSVWGIEVWTKHTVSLIPQILSKPDQKYQKRSTEAKYFTSIAEASNLSRGNIPRTFSQQEN